MVNEPKADWSKHLQATRKYPPSPLLAEALAHVIKKDRALDIGGGGLKDTRYLLSKGFETTVIDQEPLMGEMAQSLNSDKLHFYVTRFADFAFPANAFDIVSAMYALPFNLPAEFNPVLSKIKKSLVAGGIFVGNFLALAMIGTNKQQ